MSQRIPEETAKGVADLFAIVARDLYRFGLRASQGDATAADDLVQDTFHDAAMSWDSLAVLSLDRRRAWLFVVLRRKAVDRWRASTTRPTLPFVENMISPTGADDTFDRALHSMLLERCWKLLQAMPPARFRVAYLRWHDGMSTAAVAEYLGIARSTVRVHLKHARDEVVAVLGPDVPFSEDAMRTTAGREEVAQ